MRRNSLFPDYLAVASVYGDYEKDVLRYIFGDVDLADINLEGAYLKDKRVKQAIPFLPFVKKGYYPFVSNLPADNKTSQDCEAMPICKSKGWCTGYDYASIANYSISHGDVPVVYSFKTGSGREDTYRQFKENLEALGVKNITAESFMPVVFYDDYIAKHKHAAATDPTKEIWLVDFSYDFLSTACDIFTMDMHYDPAPFRLSLVSLLLETNLYSWGLNPKIDPLYEYSLNSVLQQLINEKYICQLLVTYLGICNDNTSAITNTENFCGVHNWAGLPNCTGKSQYKRGFSSIPIIEQGLPHLLPNNRLF
jgi:hypothetical protein